MENKEIKATAEMYRILFLDLKSEQDTLNYKIKIDGFEEMSGFQKWLLYKKYASEDADVVIKRNELLVNVLGWDDKWLDAIFPVKQIMDTLLKTLGQEIDYDDITEGKKEVYDIIDGKALSGKLRDAGIGNHVKSWHNLFKKELEKFCKNVNTVGNYMPCPDKNYNFVKGSKGKWHYNDRIDLLYSDILKPERKKRNNEYILDPKQREDWKAWLDANKEKLFLTEILDRDTLDTLGKFGCIKKQTFSGGELKELPEYLKKVNELIESRTDKIKAKCTQAVYNEYYEYFKNSLSEFEHGKVFMQVTSFSKGYIWVAPECEKGFEKYFGVLRLDRYFNEEPIDKEVGEAFWENFLEYAYLPLYDCGIDNELLPEKEWELDHLECRAAYFAFKEYHLIKDHRHCCNSNDDQD